MKASRIFFIAFTLLVLILVSSSIASSAVSEIDPSTLSNIFSKEIARKQLTKAPVSFIGVRVLPGFSDASIRILRTDTVNDTKIYWFTSIRNYNVEILKYNPSSNRIINNNDLLDKIMKDYYKLALDILYFHLPSAAEGVPPGSYDEIRPAGIKSLNIPQYPEVRGFIKPKLLLVLAGPTNGVETSDPFIVYYFVVEVPGKTYSDELVRVLLVLSVVLDTSGRIYGENYAGLSAYYIYGVAGSAGTYALYMALYGFLGLLAAGGILYSEVDEEYKYYLYIMLIFIGQIFSFLVILALSGIPVALLFDVVASLNQWFILLFSIWAIPYLILGYTYNSSREDIEEVSPGKIAVEGILFALVLIFLFILSIDPAGVIRYLVAVVGVEATYIYILMLSASTLFIGLTLGSLWARMSRIKRIAEAGRRF